jgi:hypothetical protein
MESSIQQRPKHTGLAIGVAVTAAVFFYVAYQFLFTFIIKVYASYDASFATGFGALLLVLGSNVLAFLSGAVVARRAFPKANAAALFYGIATLLVVLGTVSVLGELARPDAAWVVALINAAAIAITIFAVRMLLLSHA